jgi:hypothetical protein
MPMKIWFYCSKMAYRLLLFFSLSNRLIPTTI